MSLCAIVEAEKSAIAAVRRQIQVQKREQLVHQTVANSAWSLLADIFAMHVTSHDAVRDDLMEQLAHLTHSQWYLDRIRQQPMNRPGAVASRMERKRN